MTDPLALDALLDRLADRLAAKVVAQLANGAGPGSAPQPQEPDRVIGVAEVALTLGRSKRWVYAQVQRDLLPFRIRLPGPGLAFSARGLDRYLARRQGGA